MNALAYCGATRPIADRAGIGAQPSEHWRSRSRDEQLWLPTSANSESVRKGVSRSAFRRGRVGCPGRGRAIQERGRSGGRLHAGDWNDGSTPPAIASPAETPGRWRSANTPTHRNEPRGAAFRLREIWPVEQGFEPLSL